ncbi:hypothetical protein [Sphingomonas sp. RS2018]
MKKFAITTAVAVAALSLAACGGNSTTENTTLGNDIVLNDSDVLSDNLTAVDTLGNDTALALDNATDASANTLDAAGNDVLNTAN